MTEESAVTHQRWNELLQELRVMQTGVQIVTAFLMMLPFQNRFKELSDPEVATYMVLLVFSALVSALILMPVAIHRSYFGMKIISVTVANGHLLVRWALVSIALLLIGCVGFISLVVLGGTAAGILTIAVAAVILGMVMLIPWLLRRRRQREEAP